MVLVIAMVPVKHIVSISLDGQKRPGTCSEAERAEMKGRNASGLIWRPHNEDHNGVLVLGCLLRIMQGLCGETSRYLKPPHATRHGCRDKSPGSFATLWTTCHHEGHRHGLARDRRTTRATVSCPTSFKTSYHTG